jgi:hypothetical protein
MTFANQVVVSSLDLMSNFRRAPAVSTILFSHKQEYGSTNSPSCKLCEAEVSFRDTPEVATIAAGARAPLKKR